MTIRQTPLVQPSSLEPFKTVALENNLFDVNQVKQRSALAAATADTRRPLNLPSSIDPAFSNLATNNAFGANIAFDTMFPSHQAADSTSRGAARNGLSPPSNRAVDNAFVSGSLDAQMPNIIPAFETELFGEKPLPRAPVPQSTSFNQIQPAMPSLPSQSVTRVSSVAPTVLNSRPITSKADATKFHDQASLLAMVSEQITKRKMTEQPPVPSNAVRNTILPMPAVPKSKTPFESRSWNTPQVQTSVELPPPPFDVPLLPVINQAMPTIDMTMNRNQELQPTDTILPDLTASFSQATRSGSQQPVINVDTQASLGASAVNTVLPSQTPPPIVTTQGPTLSGVTSFFLDPFPTEPLPGAPTATPLTTPAPKTTPQSTQLQTQTLATNEIVVQYDMSPFKSNENWAIFDPTSVAHDVNFTNFGPILDIPIDTQIDFKSNTELNFANSFSQASPLDPVPTIVQQETQTRSPSKVSIGTKVDNTVIDMRDTSIIEASIANLTPPTDVVDFVPLVENTNNLQSGVVQTPSDVARFGVNLPPPPPF